VNLVTNEQETLQQARHFDAQTLARIYDEYSPGLYRYAYRLLGDALLAEDCVSETFQRFLTALRNGGGPDDHLQAYLYRIAHNWVTDQYRRNPLEAETLSEELASPAAHPGAAGDVIEQAHVRRALSRLTPEQRQVIVLKFLEGWSNQAIGRLMGKPPGAVKALQHRGLATLRGLLATQERNEL
jgi:RNA polymerase sigma-70 factor (ECF subfamily)